MASEFPKSMTARQLVEGGFVPVSEGVLLGAAKKHGIGRKLGRQYVFTPADIEKLYEALPTCSNFSGDQSRQTGSSAAPSADVALKKALALATAELAEEIRAKREAEIHKAQIVPGREIYRNIREAALSYLEQGGSRKFIEPVLKHFGTKPLAKIDYAAIEAGSMKVYPNVSPSTRNRQFFTPTVAILNHGAMMGLCAKPVVPATKIA